MSKSMPIQIMQKDFTLLGQIDEYASLQIESEWSNIGKIDLLVNRYLPNAHLLVMDNIIFPHGRLDRAFIIRDRRIALDEAGKITENLAIRADSLKVWFADKATIPPVGLSHDSINADAESAMHHYVHSTVINPLDSGNKLNVVLGTNQKRGMQIDWQSRYKVLSDELAQISMLSGIGWNIVVDRKNEKYIFETYEGLDLTEHNGINPHAVFSPEFQTIKNLSYTESQLDYKNYAIVAGQGEGADRRIITVGDESVTGFDRRVLFVDARDIGGDDEDGNPLTEEEVDQKLRERGEQKLAEHAQEFYLEGQALGGIVRKRDTTISAVVDDVVLDRVDLSGEGRNLIRNSSFLNGLTHWTHLVGTYTPDAFSPMVGMNSVAFNYTAGNYPSVASEFIEVRNAGKIGENVTISAYVFVPLNSDLSGNIYFEFSGYENTGQGSNPLMGRVTITAAEAKEIAGKWVGLEATAKIPETNANGTINYIRALLRFTGTAGKPTDTFWYALPKLEFGDQSTPWTPAPEDGITWYDADKTVHLDQIDLSKISTYSDSLFTWDSFTPTGTSAIVEYSLNNQTWSPLTSGQSLPFARNQTIRGLLYIRQRLLTSNQQVTPSITNFRYTINGYKLPPNIELPRLAYGIHYNLGDMTTLQSKDWGVTLDARITTVKEIYEPSKQAIELTFGNKQPTLVSKIKQELSGMKTEITR